MNKIRYRLLNPPIQSELHPPFHPSRCNISMLVF